MSLLVALATRLLLLGAIAIPAAFLAPLAAATPFTDLSSMGVGPETYAIFDLGGGTVNLSNVYVTGNVGAYQGSSITNMAPSTINGNVFTYGSGQYSGPGVLTGSNTINSLSVTDARSGVLSAASDADALIATQTFTNITTSTTITGSVGLNVIDINGNINLNNLNLTINGPAGAQFVINVSGNLTLGGTAALTTTGGVSASDVLYNFTASNASISTHVGDSVTGILLAAGASSQMNLDGTFTGELIGNKISLLSGASLTQSGASTAGGGGTTTATPEPSSLAVMGIALAGLGLIRRRIRRC